MKKLKNFLILIRPRFIVILRIIFDLFLSLFILRFLDEKYFNFSLDNVIYLIPIWIFISYISGKYSDNYNKFDNLKITNVVSLSFGSFALINLIINFNQSALYLLMALFSNIFFLIYFLLRRSNKTNSGKINHMYNKKTRMVFK